MKKVNEWNRANERAIFQHLKNRVSSWVEEDGAGEIDEWAKSTAQRLSDTFRGNRKDIFCHIEIESARLLERVYGEDKSWRKDFHNEMNWKELFDN